MPTSPCPGRRVQKRQRKGRSRSSMRGSVILWTLKPRGSRRSVVPSMRLKWLRDGVDDYDYLAMLKATGDEGKRPPAFLTTIGAMAHKGIWLPLPSFELGAGFNYLPRSAVKSMSSAVCARNRSGNAATCSGIHQRPERSIPMASTTLPVILCRSSTSATLRRTTGSSRTLVR